MNGGEARGNGSAAAEREEQAGGGHEISVETLQQAEHRGDKDQPDSHWLPVACEKAAAVGIVCLIEFATVRRTRLLQPRLHKMRRQQREPERWREKILASEFLVGFLGYFWHGFEAGHEVRNDLQHQENRNERCGVKSWMKFATEPCTALPAATTTNRISTIEVASLERGTARIPR